MTGMSWQEADDLARAMFLDQEARRSALAEREAALYADPFIPTPLTAEEQARVASDAALLSAAGGLSWSEQEAVESLVGGLVSVAGLIAHRPDTLSRVLAAVIDQLDDDERKLIVALNWEMVRRNVAEMHAEEAAQALEEAEKR